MEEPPVSSLWAFHSVRWLCHLLKCVLCFHPVTGNFKCLPASLVMKIILLTLRHHAGAVTSSGSFFPFALFGFFKCSDGKVLKGNHLVLFWLLDSKRERNNTEQASTRYYICARYFICTAYMCMPLHIHIHECISLHVCGKNGS